MPEFVDMINEIQSIAKKMSYNWSGYFVTDELVNEAWIRSLRSTNLSAPALIIKRAKYDMVDYIREKMGREYIYVDGKKVKKVKKRGIEIFKQKHYTGFHREDGELTHFDSIFDRPVEDKNFLSLENKELIDILLEETTDREETIIRKYFLEEKSLKEVGEEVGRLRCRMGSSLKRNGLSDARVSLIKKTGLEKCRRKLETMNI